MSSNGDYQPPSGEVDKDAEEKGQGSDWNENTENISTHPCSFVICMSIFPLSLSANVLLVLDVAQLRNTSRNWGKTKYSELKCSRIIFH